MVYDCRVSGGITTIYISYLFALDSWMLITLMGKAGLLEMLLFLNEN